MSSSHSNRQRVTLEKGFLLAFPRPAMSERVHPAISHYLLHLVLDNGHGDTPGDLVVLSNPVYQASLFWS